MKKTLLYIISIMSLCSCSMFAPPPNNASSEPGQETKSSVEDQTPDLGEETLSVEYVASLLKQTIEAYTITASIDSNYIIGNRNHHDWATISRIGNTLERSGQCDCVFYQGDKVWTMTDFDNDKYYFYDGKDFCVAPGGMFDVFDCMTPDKAISCAIDELIPYLTGMIDNSADFSGHFVNGGDNNYYYVGTVAFGGKCVADTETHEGLLSERYRKLQIRIESDQIKTISSFDGEYGGGTISFEYSGYTNYPTNCVAYLEERINRFTTNYLKKIVSTICYNKDMLEGWQEIFKALDHDEYEFDGLETYTLNSNVTLTNGNSYIVKIQGSPCGIIPDMYLHRNNQSVNLRLEGTNINSLIGLPKVRFEYFQNPYNSYYQRTVEGE